MIIHTVEPGESVFSIAQIYGSEPGAIIEENGLSAPYDLVVGQTLVIGGAGGEEDLGTLASNGYAYPFIQTEVLNAALPYLSAVSSFSYGFRPDGTLIEPDDGRVLSAAESEGTAAVMVLSTLGEDGRFSNNLASGMLNDPAVRDRLLSNIAETMAAKGFRALDVDFEYVFPEDAGAFVEFVAGARAALSPLGYKVICALAPKTYDEQPGLLYQGHDYYGLGAAADLVLLMTYEWGYTYGPPMAVAPINKVREVVSYALTRIPAEKILMGVPNYGYDWPLPFRAGSTRARSIGNEEAVEIARENGADILFDRTAAAPHFEYLRDGVEHEVWFEDARSVKAKLELAAENGLFGFSVWNIMRPFRQMWCHAIRSSSHR